VVPDPFSGTSSSGEASTKSSDFKAADVSADDSFRADSKLVDGIAPDELSPQDAKLIKEQCQGLPMGEGSFGKVYRVRFHDLYWAAKIIPYTGSSSQKETLIKKEIHVHRNLRALRCVMFRAAYTRPPEIIILTEFCSGGNLGMRIHGQESLRRATMASSASSAVAKAPEHKPLDDKHRYRYALQIAEGLVEIHTQNPPIVHRDLKPSNVLLDENDNVKLCDFGLAHTQQHSSTAESTYVRARSGAGTDLYKPPEVWDPSARATTTADTYSFGVLLHELFDGEAPWADKTKEMLMTLHLLQKKSPPVSDKIKQQYPGIAKVIEGCCRHDPPKRMKDTDVVKALRALAEQIKE